MKTKPKKSTNLFVVGQSKINMWRRCKYAAYLRYVQCLRKKVSSRPLRFGTIIHKMIEAHANGEDAFKWLDAHVAEVRKSKLFAVEKETILETVSEARLIMQDYFQYWKERPANEQYVYDRRKGKNAEHEIVLPLVDGIVVKATLDAIATTLTHKSKLLVENKSFRQMPSDDHRWRNLQTNLYTWILDKLDIHVDRICWNYIRSKVPTVPSINKDGTISRRQLDTLPATLREWGKENKIAIPHVMMTNAVKNRSEYFSREFTRPREETIKLLVADFTESAIEMSEQLGKSKAKTVDRHCEWCDFEPICRAELTGSDRDYVIQKEYEREDDEADFDITEV